MVRTKQLTPVFLMALMAACNSGNNPAGPAANRGNLPTLANAPPNALPSLSIKRVKLQGRVLDALTGQPVEKALVLIQSQGQSEPTAQPSLPATPQSAPAPSPSLGLLATPSPLVSPLSLLASPSPSAGGFSIQADAPDAASPMPSRAPSAPPPLPAKPAYTDRTTSNNEGKFWFNGVPEGALTVSVSAPKYRAMTLVGVDPAKLEFALLPQQPEQVTVAGKVLSATGTPVFGALVSASSPFNGPLSPPETSDAAGAFALEGVLPGDRRLVAVVQDKGDVQAFGWIEKVRVEGKEREGSFLEKLIPKGKPSAVPPPTLKLASVVKGDIYEGTLQVPDGMRPRQLHAYLRWEGEEAFLFSRPLDADTRHFRVELPTPPEGASYHLELTAQGKDQISYYHVYDLVKGQKDLKVAFAQAPNKLSAIPSETPTFRWDGDGDLFRVALLDTVKDEVIWEAWTTQTSLTYPLTVGGAKLSNKGKYEWRVSAVKDVSGGGKLNAQAIKGGWTSLAQGATEALKFPQKTDRTEP